MVSMWWHWVEAYIEEVDEDDEPDRTAQASTNQQGMLDRQTPQACPGGSEGSH